MASALAASPVLNLQHAIARIGQGRGLQPRCRAQC